MIKNFDEFMRWLFLLPISILSGILVAFPVHWVLYVSLSAGENPIITPYPEYPEQILQPLFSSYTMITVVHNIAPKYKYRASLVFASVLIFLLVAFYILSFKEISLGGFKFYQKLAGIPNLAAIAGVVIGFYRIRHKDDNDVYIENVTDTKIHGNRKIIATVASYLAFFFFGILSFENIIIRKVFFSVVIIILSVICLVRLKDGFTATRNQKLNLLLNLLLIFWLVISFSNGEQGKYVLVALLALQLFSIIRNLLNRMK
jgi:hypothetical protein